MEFWDHKSITIDIVIAIGIVPHYFKTNFSPIFKTIPRKLAVCMFFEKRDDRQDAFGMNEKFEFVVRLNLNFLDVFRQHLQKIQMKLNEKVFFSATNTIY